MRLRLRLLLRPVGGDIRRVVDRLPVGVEVLLLVHGGEFLQHQAVRRERGVGEESAGIERVVGAEHVDEGLPLDDDLLAGVAEPAADARPRCSTPISAVWKTRLPVSRAYPRSADTDSAGPSNSCDAVSGAAQHLPGGLDGGGGIGSGRRRRVVKPASRSSRAGVFGGFARSALRWCMVRGTTHPMRETNSSR